MMRHNHIHHINAIQHYRQDASVYANTLAKRLVASLGVQPGRELVPCLGCGTESSNLAAIESWAFMACTTLKLPFSLQSLPILEGVLAPALDALKAQGVITCMGGVHHG